MESEREREKEREEETRAGHVPLHVKGLKNDDDEDGDDQQPKNEDLNLFLFQLWEIQKNCVWFGLWYF